MQLSAPPSSCTLSGAATSCMGQPLVMPLLVELGWEMHRGGIILVFWAESVDCEDVGRYNDIISAKYLSLDNVACPNIA